VPSFRGITEAYVFLTGDKHVSGRFMPQNLARELQVCQDIDSTSFSYMLGNTLHRRMVAEYVEASFHEERIVSNEKSVNDFRTQEAVKLGFFPDLATVDVESADYQEITGVTDEESTYTVAIRGNLLTITWPVIVNDDMSVISRMVSRLGRAARRTKAKRAWAPFISNMTCSDGTAWFTAGHGNLGSTALSFATAEAAYLALAGMTEKDSGEKIGILDDARFKPCLVYPTALMKTGEMIVKDEYYYSSNDFTTKARNFLLGKIDGVALSLLSDANDWGMLMPPKAVDMVEIGYLHGKKEPELFLANNPQAGWTFLNDSIKYKIRHVYNVAIVDYVGGYKAVVA